MCNVANDLKQILSGEGFQRLWPLVYFLLNSSWAFSDLGILANRNLVSKISKEPLELGS